jgi:hypothetical protein
MGQRTVTFCSVRETNWNKQRPRTRPHDTCLLIVPGPGGKDSDHRPCVFSWIETATRNTKTCFTHHVERQSITVLSSAASDCMATRSNTPMALFTSQQGNGGSISRQRPIRSARTWRGNIVRVPTGLLLRFTGRDRHPPRVDTFNFGSRFPW